MPPIHHVAFIASLSMLDPLPFLSCSPKMTESCNATGVHGVHSTTGKRQLAIPRPADAEEATLDCEHYQGGGTDTAEISVPSVPDIYACTHTPAVWASMTHTARTAHHRAVRAAKKAAEGKEASLEDQASVDAVAIAKRNTVTATRRAQVALSLKTSLRTQLVAANLEVFQTAQEATLAGRALDSERCSASRILAARQHLSDGGPSSSFSRGSSSLSWHCTSPPEYPTGPTSLAASSRPDCLGSPPHYTCRPTPGESCLLSEDGRYGTMDLQQLASSPPADIEEDILSHEPDKGSSTDTSEVSASSMPGKYAWAHTPAVWAGMTATARAAHVEVVRAAKDSANLVQESLEHQASSDAVAIATRSVATAMRRSAAAISLKDSLRAQLEAAESTVIQTADKAAFAGQDLDSEKARASRILADRQRVSSQDPSPPFSWSSSPPRLDETKQSSKRPRSASKILAD